MIQGLKQLFFGRTIQETFLFLLFQIIPNNFKSQKNEYK